METLGGYACAKGGEAHPGGGCAGDGSVLNGDCPGGSHYSNADQYCMDDTTGQKLADLCPAGSPYFWPEGHVCTSKNWHIKTDCESWTITMGSCQTKVHAKEPTAVPCNPTHQRCP